MGLADRDYMRDDQHPVRVTMKLIVVLIVAFVIECLFIVYGNVDILGKFGLSAAGLKSGNVAQLLTFQFLHSAPWPWHVLLNCLALYFLGPPVEEVLGAKKFIIIYLLCGVVGGLLQVGTTMLLGHFDAPVVGASAGICGIVAIYCALFPMQELTTWIYFFPVTVRARYLLIFLTLLSLFGTIIPFDGVAHAAHLGGIALGVGYVWWTRSAPDRFAKLKLFRRREQPRETVAAGSGRKKSWRSGAIPTAEDLSAEEFLQKEVDPILEKITAHGLHSLTDRERKILEKARNKIERR